MSSYKRKRYSGKSRTYSKKKRGSYIKPYQRGYVRKGGAYGRYLKGGEMKFLDVTLDDAVVSSTGTVTPTINIIVQGTSPVQRIGRKVIIKKIMWKGTYGQSSQTAMGVNGELLRVIMFKDKQCNGATATVTDILESADINAFRNLNNSARFTMLYDKTIELECTNAIGVTGAIETGNIVKHFECYKEVNIPIEFDSTTGAITEIRSNNIGTLLISGDAKVFWVSKIRLRYTDN